MTAHVPVDAVATIVFGVIASILALLGISITLRLTRWRCCTRSDAATTMQPIWVIGVHPLRTGNKSWLHFRPEHLPRLWRRARKAYDRLTILRHYRHRNPTQFLPIREPITATPRGTSQGFHPRRKAQTTSMERQLGKHTEHPSASQRTIRSGHPAAIRASLPDLKLVPLPTNSARLGQNSTDIHAIVS